MDIDRSNDAGATPGPGEGPAGFRSVLGHFASGVVVVTGIGDSTPAGFTCQSFFSLSLEPPLIALAPALSSLSWSAIASSGGFCVNVLSAGQEAVSRAFARSGADKFAGVGWDESPSTKSPRLCGALAWLDCAISEVHRGGDHWLVIGEVVDLGSAAGEPLVFYRGGFGTFAAPSASVPATPAPGIAATPAPGIAATPGPGSPATPGPGSPATPGPGSAGASARAAPAPPAPSGRPALQPEGLPAE